MDNWERASWLVLGILIGVLYSLLFRRYISKRDSKLDKKQEVSGTKPVSTPKLRFAKVR